MALSVSGAAVFLSAQCVSSRSFSSLPSLRLSSSCSTASTVAVVRGKATFSSEECSAPDPAAKMEEYNKAMKSQMRNPYEYHHDLGMNYTRIVENLIVGSQPQSMEDIDHLYVNEGVSAILNLQQDKDIEYWRIDLPSIIGQCEKNEMKYLRIPARDFDPQSLRNELPRAAAALEAEISKGRTVYVHCTAGLGRSPGVAIAYLFWFSDMDLDSAYTLLTTKRPCGPKKEAIRGATYDLTNNNSSKTAFEKLPAHAFADVSAQERQLIQQRVRSLRSSL